MMKQLGVILRVTKNGAEPALQPALKIEVVPNVVRAIRGGLRSLCTPLLLFNHF
jgi:hypothetical protein